MPIRVLIVEDEPAIADALIYVFKEAGDTITHVTLGLDAIQQHQTKPFEFIVLDVGLPDISGFEVCKQIRQHSNVPILFLTARNHEVDRIVGLEIGADDYITKPFSPREIVTRSRTILRRMHTQHPPSEPSKPTFLIDESAHRIQFHGQWLSLTRYEFLLLKLLVEHPTRIYSRSQIMDAVWQYAENTLDRTVDAHIKTLRAKLREVHPENDAIVTHRGLGYSLLS